LPAEDAVTIRTRIIIWLLLIVAGGFYYLTNWVIRDLRPHYLKSMEVSLIDIATLLSSSVANRASGVAALPVDDLRAAFNDAYKRSFKARVYDVTKEEMNIRIYVTDAKGIVIFDSDNGRDEGKDFSRWNDVYLTLQGTYGARSTRDDESDPNSSVLYIGSPIIINNMIAGVLTVSKPARSVNQYIEHSRDKIIWAGSIAAVAVAAVGILLSIWVTGPIRKLTVYARAVKDGKHVSLPRLGTFDAYGHSEMGVMGRALDEMRDALEGKRYVERYVQTLTHEIKSPLSAIRGAAELLDEEMPPDRRAQFIRNIRGESDRIRNMIDRLLQLSELESRKALKDVEAIALSELVAVIGASIAPQFSKKNVALNISTSETATVRGERFLIRQAIENLLQNALDFTPAGGTVTTAIHRRDSRAVVTIDDTGTGIPEFASEKIYERFYSLPRPDTSRKSTGLGLSFVREVAQLHEGAIALVNRPEGGTRACLELPLCG
jgi:two-component system sensor histidine kinase CreC